MRRPPSASSAKGAATRAPRTLVAPAYLDLTGSDRELFHETFVKHGPDVGRVQWAETEEVARDVPTSRRRRTWRFVTSCMLLVVMLGSLAGMAFVIHDRVGFAPVLSPSMVPAFGPGDLLVTRSEPTDQIKVGQIVALPVHGDPDERYVHRIIAVGRDKKDRVVVRTKGDANPAPEPYRVHITSKTVPLVIGSVPRLGRVSVWLHRSVARVVLLLITLLFGGIAAYRLISDVTYRERTEDNS